MKKLSKEPPTRAKQDNPGTLPVTAYGRRGLVANPSLPVSEIHDSITSDAPASDEDEDHEIYVDHDCMPVLSDLVSTITFTKWSTPLILHDERVPAHFLLENLAQEWKPWKLTEVNQKVFVDMCSNLGVKTFRSVD